MFEENLTSAALSNSCFGQNPVCSAEQQMKNIISLRVMVASQASQPVNKGWRSREKVGQVGMGKIQNRLGRISPVEM